MKSVLRTFLTTLLLTFSFQSVIYSAHAIKHAVEYVETNSHHSQDQKIDSACDLCVVLCTNTYSLNSSAPLLIHSLVFQKLVFFDYDSVFSQKISTVRARAPPQSLI